MRGWLEPILIFTIGSTAALGAAAGIRAVQDGVYTEEQSRRGEEIYFVKCVLCHKAEMTGSEVIPSLVGEVFAARWSTRTAGDLFEWMRTSMPPVVTSRLTPQEYADVLAFILSRNRAPAGKVELAADFPTLAAIRMAPGETDGASETAAGTLMPEAARSVLDAALSIVKENALRRDRVDWKRVEAEVREMAAGAATSAEVYPAIRNLLSRLGDRHSFLMTPERRTAFQAGGAENPAPEVRSLPERAGYIGVPAYSGGEPGAIKNYATSVHDAILEALGSAPCGWVVDLRENTGGNMWPMLAGLKPFLGDNVLGTFVTPDGSSSPWVAGDGMSFELTPELAALEYAWVAVLTGPKTTSSGEAVTIAFRGRPRTRSFGEPTAGLPTANQTFPLPDGGMIFLTTAVEADRTGRRYEDRIEPDDLVLGEDPLLSAVEWLHESSGCSAQSRAASHS